jgi:hypothetical protein
MLGAFAGIYFLVPRCSADDEQTPGGSLAVTLIAFNVTFSHASRRRRPHAPHLQPIVVRFPQADAALERDHHGGALPTRAVARLRRELPLEPRGGRARAATRGTPTRSVAGALPAAARKLPGPRATVYGVPSIPALLAGPPPQARASSPGSGSGGALRHAQFRWSSGVGPARGDANRIRGCVGERRLLALTKPRVVVMVAAHDAGQFYLGSDGMAPIRRFSIRSSGTAGRRRHADAQPVSRARLDGAWSARPVLPAGSGALGHCSGLAPAVAGLATSRPL